MIEWAGTWVSLQGDGGIARGKSANKPLAPPDNTLGAEDGPVHIPEQAAQLLNGGFQCVEGLLL